MELRHLRCFVAVAEELHFGHAAERLMIAQPPLSQTIKQLEKEVGAVLFHRTKRVVRLTEAGRAFLDHARQTLAAADRATWAAQRADRGETGHLTVGMVGSAAIGPMPAILRAFRARCPAVQLTLCELMPAEQVQALREERIDLGVTFPPVEDEAMEVAPLLREPFIAALPARHPLARRKRVAFARLAQEPFVCCTREVAPGLYAQVMDSARQVGLSLRVVQEAPRLLPICALVAAEVGVSIVPASVRTMARRGVVYRDLEAPAPMVEIALAWRRGDQSAALRTFVDVAQQTVGKTR